MQLFEKGFMQHNKRINAVENFTGTCALTAKRVRRNNT